MYQSDQLMVTAAFSSVYPVFEAKVIKGPATINFIYFTVKNRIFSVCAPPPPSLVGAYYLQPPDARAIFLHNDLLCNDTCSVTGGSITYWGGTNGKDPKNLTVISAVFLTLCDLRLAWMRISQTL